MGIKNDAGTVSAIPYAILTLVIFGLTLVAFGAVIDELVSVDTSFAEASRPNAPGAVVTGPTYVPAAVTPSGPVVVWGSQDYGACDVPPVLIATKVAMGDDHGLAIREGGSVVAWGDYEYGDCGVVPPSIRAKDLAVGDYHSLVLKTDGTVYGTGEYSEVGSAPPGMEGTVFTQIATSDSMNAGVTPGGTVIVWDKEWAGTPSDFPGSVKQVALDRYSGEYAILLNDGTVSFFDNKYGVPGGITAKKVAGGEHFFVILKSDGSVAVYHHSSYDDNYGVTNVPHDLVATDIAAGDGHVVALRPDGTVVCWGANWGGQCIVPAGLRAISVAAGTDTTAVIAVPGTEPGPDWTPAPGDGGNP